MLKNPSREGEPVNKEIYNSIASVCCRRRRLGWSSRSTLSGAYKNTNQTLLSFSLFVCLKLALSSLSLSLYSQVFVSLSLCLCLNLSTSLCSLYSSILLSHSLFIAKSLSRSVFLYSSTLSLTHTIFVSFFASHTSSIFIAKSLLSLSDSLSLSLSLSDSLSLSLTLSLVPVSVKNLSLQGQTFAGLPKNQFEARKRSNLMKIF